MDSFFVLLREGLNLRKDVMMMIAQIDKLQEIYRVIITFYFTSISPLPNNLMLILKKIFAFFQVLLFY
jgi:hypothetical protein